MSENENESRDKLLREFAKFAVKASSSVAVGVLASFASMLISIRSIVTETDFRWYHWAFFGFLGLLLLFELLSSLFRSSVFSVSIRMVALNVTVWRFATYQRKNRIATADLALSITYLNHLKQGHIGVKSALLLSVVTFSIAAHYLGIDSLRGIALLPLIPLALLTFQELVVEHRIRNGLFGDNPVEAKAMINFMIQNAEDIDFTDNNGKLRKALVPTVEKEGKSAGLVGSGAVA